MLLPESWSWITKTRQQGNFFQYSVWFTTNKNGNSVYYCTVHLGTPLTDTVAAQDLHLGSLWVVSHSSNHLTIKLRSDITSDLKNKEMRGDFLRKHEVILLENFADSSSKMAGHADWMLKRWQKCWYCLVKDPRCQAGYLYQSAKQFMCWHTVLMAVNLGADFTDMGRWQALILLAAGDFFTNWFDFILNVVHYQQRSRQVSHTARR